MDIMDKSLTEVLADTLSMGIRTDWIRGSGAPGEVLVRLDHKQEYSSSVTVNVHQERFPEQRITEMIAWKIRNMGRLLNDPRMATYSTCRPPRPVFSDGVCAFVLMQLALGRSITIEPLNDRHVQFAIYEWHEGGPANLATYNYDPIMIGHERGLVLCVEYLERMCARQMPESPSCP